MKIVAALKDTYNDGLCIYCAHTHTRLYLSECLGPIDSELVGDGPTDSYQHRNEQGGPQMEQRLRTLSKSLVKESAV